MMLRQHMQRERDSAIESGPHLHVLPCTVLEMQLAGTVDTGNVMEYFSTTRMGQTRQVRAQASGLCFLDGGKLLWRVTGLQALSITIMKSALAEKRDHPQAETCMQRVRGGSAIMQCKYFAYRDCRSEPRSNCGQRRRAAAKPN